MHQACLKQIYVCIYVCIIYHYALRNAKIELNERPPFTPSNWHYWSCNCIYTAMFADNPMPIYQLVTCMLYCGEHRAGYPPGATLGVDPGLHHRCALSGGWLATGRGSRRQWSRAWERSYYSYRRHATSNFVLAIPLNSWYGSIVS